MYDDNQNTASLGHEVIAGGAAFAGFKAFEDHQRKEGKLSGSPQPHDPLLIIRSGKPISHAFAKELLAGFAGAEVDKLAETKGEDFFDRERAKHDAQKNAERMYDEHYIENQGADQYDPNQYAPPDRIQQQFGNNW